VLPHRLGYRSGWHGDISGVHAAVRSTNPFRYNEEDFQERAAIIEYCGNLPRIEAEQLASEGVIQSLEVYEFKFEGD
jgi:hypothetical protein